MTTYDDNVNSVQCDECDNWFHCFCEGFSKTEEMGTSELQYYKCLTCSGVTDVVAIYEAKIAQLIANEDQMMVQFVEKKSACDNLKGKMTSKMGDKEKLLSEKLESIHVVRQVTV